MSIKNPQFIVKANETKRKTRKPSADYAFPSFLNQLEIKDVNANWIWENGCEAQSAVCFVKDFTLDFIPETAITRISADSKYVLWVNGEKTVLEGGLKRGFAPDSVYCDEIDIAPYLKMGENRIAAWVRYFGYDGYSHVSSGEGGFLLECRAAAVRTDASFKCKRDSAYIPELDSEMIPNYRLAEGNIYYDAREELGEFYLPDFDVSSWENATEKAYAGEGAYGKLYPRIIPMFKDFGVSDFVSTEIISQKKLFADKIYECILPYNCHIVPIIEVDAPAGKRIDVYTDMYCDANGLSQRLVYITKKGVQSYESPSWINGGKVYFHIPCGVKVISLKYRETGYDSEFSGGFECDDTVLNAVYEKSRRTLYVTMRDTFMDCPDRERAQWWGDAVNESELCYFCMDEKAALLFKKGILSMAAWQHTDGVLQTVTPDKIDLFELPLQNLAGIVGFLNYYKFTGDSSVLPVAYKASLAYLSLWETEENGLVSHRKGSWDWPDWGVSADMPVLENAWYYYALLSVIEMHRIIGKNQGIEILEERAARLKNAFNHVFYDGNAYLSSSGYDDRANAVAVISGLADKDTYKGIAKVFDNVYNSSPYMEKYVLEALCRMDLHEKAKNRIRKRYSEMAKSDYSTLWEFWSAGAGTKNHAWSGGPLVIMSRYFAGVSPLTAGYGTCLIKPELAGLYEINAEIPTPNGTVGVKARKTDNAVKYIIDVPKKGGAVIAIRASESDGVFINGERAELLPKAQTEGMIFLKADATHLYFAATAGKKEIITAKSE
ncbi:MAG: glycoside hydrolase [Clostridia bacterium]|nr:glycoside hydrolase [Clostridia bacterium]